MRIRFAVVAMIFSMALPDGTWAHDPEPSADRLRFDELIVLSEQGMGDDALIAVIEQRGVAFVLAPEDVDRLLVAGVSGGVLRYLQGRASAEQAMKSRIASGRYRVNTYYGGWYRGFPYLGYYAGLHYYGSHVAYDRFYDPYHGAGHYGGGHFVSGHHDGGDLIGGHNSGGHLVGGHRGGHRGGGHGGGHNGGGHH